MITITINGTGKSASLGSRAVVFVPPGSGDTSALADAPSFGQPYSLEQDNRLINPGGSGSPEAAVRFDLWQMVRRGKWRIVFALTVALSLAALYAVLAGPWYEAKAQLLVLKKRLETTPISGPNVGQPRQEDYLATHMLVITSPRIARRAIREGHLQDLKSSREEDKLAEVVHSLSSYLLGGGPKGQLEDVLTDRIVNSLKASGDVAKPGVAPSREVLTVAFRGKVAEDCGKTLDAVMASYQEFLRDAYLDVNSETLKLINNAKEVLQKEIAANEAAYREFRQTTPVLWKGKDGITIHQDRLFNIDAKRSALRMRRAEIQASLKAIESAPAAGRGRVILALLARQDPSNAGRSTGTTLEEDFIKLQFEEKNLLQSYGEAHPQVRSVRDKIQQVRHMLTPSSASANSESKPSAWDALVDLKAQLLKQEFEENQRADKLLEELFEHDKKDADAAIVHEIEDEKLRTRIERGKLLYEGIVARLREIDSVKDYGGFNTQILAAPKTERYVKQYLMVFGGALFLGFMGGFGWAFLAEVRDKSFRTSHEIRDRLGLPVVGHIPYFHSPVKMLSMAESNAAALHPSLCTYHRSSSREAEAYLALRMALYFATKAKECRVIQVTSPVHGEGKTTLAANLAVSVARSGKRVILIDADFRRPQLAELFGVSSQVGLTSVLAGVTGLAEAVQQSALPGLSILGSGPLPPNPAEALDSPRLKELLDTLRQQHDFVLVDTPPLLAVPDPRVVAHAVDGVLLTLRDSKDAKLHAQFAKEILDGAGANVLGVVVNGVTDQSAFTGYAYSQLSDRRWVPKFKTGRLS